MADITVQQQRFEEAASWPGRPLSSFFSAQPANLLPVCHNNWPEFFNHNLVSPYRVLKVFRDSPHSNLRVFYYQLLRVTYEVETDQGFNRSFIYNLKQIVFSDGFEVFFSMDTDNQRDLYNDQQFKRLFAEFINLLQADGLPQVENALNSYPIMDTVFIHIFRSILANQDINFPFGTKIPTETVIGELSGLLGLVVQAFGNNCWKFDDSDMFCYEHNENELYLAFIVDAGVVTSEEASQEPNSVPNVHVDGSTTQTIQLEGTGYIRPVYTESPSEKITGAEYVRPVYAEPVSEKITGAGYERPVYAQGVPEKIIGAEYIRPVYGGAGAPATTNNFAYESVPTSVIQRVEDITYKPAASIGLVASYEANPMSSSLAQSSYQSSNYGGYEPYKSSTGAFGSFDVPAGTGSAFSQNNSGTKPNSAYTGLPDYKPSYDLPITTAAGDLSGKKYGVTNSFSSGLGSGGDYYNDFTNDRLLEKLEEPFRSKVAQIKSRVKGWRRAQASDVGVAVTTSYSSFSQSWAK